MQCRPSKISFQREHERKADPKSQCLVIGASIANHLHRHELYKHGFSNFGIGGDRIEHILFRATYGRFPEKIETCVVMGGTNNLERDDPEWIANTILTVGDTLKRRFGMNVRVFVVDILPRDAGDSFYTIRKRGSVNRSLFRGCRSRGYHFIDTSMFEGAGCRINENLYDYSRLHLNKKGYKLLADTILNHIQNVNKNYEMEHGLDDGFAIGQAECLGSGWDGPSAPSSTSCSSPPATPVVHFPPLTAHPPTAHHRPSWAPALHPPPLTSAHFPPLPISSRPLQPSTSTINIIGSRCLGLWCLGLRCLGPRHVGPLLLA